MNSSRPSPEPGGEGLLAGPSGQRGATTGAEDADTRKLLRNRARTTTAQRLTPLARRPLLQHRTEAAPIPQVELVVLTDRPFDAASRSIRRSARCRTRSRQPHRSSRPAGILPCSSCPGSAFRPTSSPPQRHHLPPRRSNRSDRAYAASVWFPNRCAPGPPRPPRAGDLSAPTSTPGNDDRKSCETASLPSLVTIFERTEASLRLPQQP